MNYFKVCGNCKFRKNISLDIQPIRVYYYCLLDDIPNTPHLGPCDDWVPEPLPITPFRG